MQFHILHRTGGIWSTFTGTTAEALTHCDRLNSTDEQGTTTLHSSFNTHLELELEFYSLND